MMKTKTTPCGGSSSHQPRGMATATFASTEGEAEQQFADAPGEETEDSQDWPNWKEGARSPRVKQVTNPSRWKEEQRHLPKITDHPQNRDLRKNPKNQKKKLHPFSLIT